MRYLTKDDFRVMTAIELGMKNHEMVPVNLIVSLSKLRFGGSHKILATLLRHKLIAHSQKDYNGYRLSYLGYDILALHTLLGRGVLVSVGSQIGIGKESDIFEAQTENGDEIVIKIHRLGRTSFRAVRKQRDYLSGGKCKINWLFLSRLAAIKEIAFMKALHANGFPTPTPIDQNRHIVVMNRVNGFPMSQIKSGQMEFAAKIFKECLKILVDLAQHGLIHCDFNEFNLMVNQAGLITLIDFPQMISINHPNASELFTRDVNCLIKFFAMKMRYIPDIVSSQVTLENILTSSSKIRLDMTVQDSVDVSEEDLAILNENMMAHYVGEEGDEEEVEEDEDDEGEYDIGEDLEKYHKLELNIERETAQLDIQIRDENPLTNNTELVSHEMKDIGETVFRMKIENNGIVAGETSSQYHNINQKDVVIEDVKLDNEEEVQDEEEVEECLTVDVLEIRSKVKRQTGKFGAGNQAYSKRNYTKKRTTFGKIDRRERTSLMDGF